MTLEYALQHLGRESAESVIKAERYYKALFFFSKMHAWDQYDELMDALDTKGGFEDCPVDYIASSLYSLALKSDYDSPIIAKLFGKILSMEPD